LRIAYNAASQFEVSPGYSAVSSSSEKICQVIAPFSFFAPESKPSYDQSSGIPISYHETISTKSPSQGNATTFVSFSGWKLWLWCRLGALNIGNDLFF
jgi:hypothetical protein